MPIYVEKIKDKKNGKMIEKKVDGQKQYFIRTYVEDENGLRKQITRHNKKWLGRNGYNLARQEEIRLKNDILIEEEKNKNITLHELEEMYLKYIKSTIDHDSLHTQKIKLDHFCEIDYTNQVNTYPNKPIKNITKDIYINWKNEMRKKKYQNGTKSYNYSIKYLNNIHNVIISMFDFAITNGYIQFNVAKQVGKFGTSKEIKMCKQNQIYTTISYEEYIRLMNATKNDLKYNIIFDLWFTRGPRPGEIRAFKINDYNFEKKQLMVNHTLSKSNELKEPKTVSSKNTIDLDDELNHKINELVLSYKKEKNFCDEWFLFGNKDIPISSHALNYNKNKYFKLANINKENMRLHDFRHSCATWLFSIGIPVTVICRILRHQDVSTTLKTYTHLVENDYINALYKLQEIKKQDQNQD